MIDKLPLVFSGNPPDLSDPAFLALVREAPAAGAWVRWTALLLGGSALVGVVLIWTLIVLPEGWLGVIGLRSLGGKMTIAGHVFFGIVCALGLVGLSFALRLFADEAPYRQPPETLGRYELRRGELTDFGPWLSAGGEYNRFQRVRWRLGETTGTSPYVSLTLSIWLRAGDPAWIGVDPAGEGSPIFLGAARATPQVLKSGTNDFRELYEALKQHLAEGGDARAEKLLKVWGAGRR